MPAAITIDAVRETKLALNRLGYYLPGHDGINDDPNDPAFADALYAFRRVKTIPFDETDIGPGSLTDRILLEELAREDKDANYIWCTVGDEKVREEHAARNGKIYSFGDPPNGENPGEDYNCRCWAEPVNPHWNTWSNWLEQRREERARANTLQSLTPPKGLKDDLIDLTTHPPVDAITPVYPLETILGGIGTKILTKFSINAVKKFAIKQEEKRLAQEAAKIF